MSNSQRSHGKQENGIFKKTRKGNVRAFATELAAVWDDTHKFADAHCKSKSAVKKFIDNMFDLAFRWEWLNDRMEIWCRRNGEGIGSFWDEVKKVAEEMP